jgi:hypothetical protein
MLFGVKAVGLMLILCFWLGNSMVIGAGFHSGGVGYCSGCHTMHEPGKVLCGSDPSSVCLNCHATTQKVMSHDGSVYSPGGDFFWLTQSYLGVDYASPDYTHGHNVVAADYGLVSDPVRAVAPGSGATAYQSAWLGCHSCHDPHGRLAGSSVQSPITQSGSYGNSPDGGNYRLLGGQGYSGGLDAIGFNYSFASPIAKAYQSSQGEWPAETDTNHVDYGSGMTEWCTNCHAGIDIQAHNVSFTHPSGAGAPLGSAEIASYDTYVATGDLSGLNATAFDRLVPFERGTTDSKLLDTASTTGPTMTAQVMCLTCHRAHATPFSNSGRWDFVVQNLNDSPVLISPQGTHAYYGDNITTRYNALQGQLCEKCHSGTP